MKQGITIKNFRKRFSAEEDCLKYFKKEKWGAGYRCIKCGCDRYGKGHQWFYRRCKGCGYAESVKPANTMFHKCKLGLLRAFEMGFRVSVKKTLNYLGLAK